MRSEGVRDGDRDRDRDGDGDLKGIGERKFFCRENKLLDFIGLEFVRDVARLDRV